MKKTSRLTALSMCAAIVLCASSCGGTNTGKPAEAATTTATTEATTTSNTLDDDLKNPVDIQEFVDDEATLENPNLTYLGFYDMRTAGDIKPGVKLFEETYGGKIDYYQVAWGERIDKLQMLISSGDSPDLVDKEDIAFPLLISKNVYEDLTDYIDLSQPQWDGYQDLIERYAWNGKHCYYPFTVNALPNCLIYDKGRFEELGISDPKEMYEAGEWTWDTFKDCMVKYMNSKEGAEGGIYGLISNDIFATTGTALIDVDNGKITNNFSSSVIDRAATYLADLRKAGLTIRGDGMWSNESEPLATGRVAFLGVGQWKITDFCKEYPDQEFGFVPYPRDPNADDYYYNLSSFSYMVPKGSKNVEGAATFIDIMRKCNTDPDLKAVVKESIMNDKQYSEEQYEFLTSFEDIANFKVVVNAYSGFSSDLTPVIDDMLLNIAFETDASGSWAQLVSENEGIINTVLDNFGKE